MPQAILLQDVEQLGDKGTVVDVSKGYLRNFLIPRKLAEPATRGSIEAARRRQVSLDKAQAEASQRAQDNAAVLNKTVLTISHQAGDDGRLFGSVTTEDISNAIHEARGLRIDRRHIHLDDAIKTIGTHMVTVEVAPGVQASVKTIVAQRLAPRHIRSPWGPPPCGPSSFPGGTRDPSGAACNTGVTKRAAFADGPPRAIPGSLSSRPPMTLSESYSASSAPSVPPQSLEAEQSVLGAVLLSDQTLYTLRIDINLQPEDFYRPIARGHLRRDARASTSRASRSTS